MTWRGSADAKDRFFGALVYLVPILGVLPFSQFFFNQFPQLAIIYLPLTPLINIYYGFPLAQLIIFFVLFLGVVRNYRVSHFIRFNTMQAILIDILLFLVSLVLRVLGIISLSPNLLIETMYNVVFLATLIASFYSIIQSALGRYPEIPTISEAAYSQVRW